MRQGPEYRITVVVNLTGENRVHQRSRAGKRHHRRLDAYRRIEKKAADIRNRANAGVPHVELALVRLRIGDKFFEIIGRKILADRKQLRLLGNQPDRLEILLRVIAEIGIEKRCRRMRTHVPGNQRVAISSGARRAQRSDGAAGAADIFDDELLSEVARKDVGNDPSGDVGWPAGSEWHNHGHRFCRVILRLRSADARKQNKQSRELSFSHRPLPLNFLQFFMDGTIPCCARECSRRKPGANAQWRSEMELPPRQSCALLRISRRATPADTYDALWAPGEVALKSPLPIAAARTPLASGWAAFAETV